MLGVGLPLPAIKHKMIQDGREDEVSILDKSPNDLYPIKIKTKEEKEKEKKREPPKTMRPKVRSRKIFWNEIDTKKIENSLWNQIKEEEEIPVDNKEIEELFTMSEMNKVFYNLIIIVNKKRKRRKSSTSSIIILFRFV